VSPAGSNFSVSEFQSFPINSRIGDVFSWALVIFTAAGLLALLGQKAIRSRRQNLLW
jgi:hypothetical protein